MAQLTNREILALAKDDQSFNKWTSKLTDEIFTAAGYESFNQLDPSLKADFFNLSIRVILQKIKRPNARIPGVYNKIVEEYSNDNGGIFQRINTKLLKPTSPQYRNLVNGGSVDPFKIRKPETSERFFKQNFDFQNMLTIQDIELKKMFLSETGINDYVAGILASLDESYAIQKFETMREMIHLMISSTNNPLKDSQKIEVPEVNESSTNAQMSKFIQVMHNLHSMMKNSVTSGEFNVAGYEHGMFPEDYVLMVKADVWNQIKTTLLATTYHTENLGVPFEVEEVKDFGGITYQLVSDHSTPVLPVYDDFGAVIGYNTTGTGDPLDPSLYEPVDPHTKVDAILVQKGAIFTTKQQPYTTRSIYNPAGEYTNLFASQPNGSFNVDNNYDVVEFYHA